MIRQGFKKVGNFINILRVKFLSVYFGFVQGHAYLTNCEINSIKALVANEEIGSEDIIAEFETSFALLTGEGECVSFAAARMAFYSLMKELKIGVGDEVIMQAANCSVMANAVLRLGATPIFADIDPDTFGSSEAHIKNKITERTKMIVAQHSFGIPCKIQGIVSLAKQHKIFLLEDCALTLASAVSGISVGNWGDAALFSTDHSKPMNTFIGGMLYTKNKLLRERLKRYRDTLESLSAEHQQRLFTQFMFEKKYFNPQKLGSGNLVSYFIVMLKKLKLRNWITPLLTDDYVRPDSAQKANYPYPAKLPVFLAKVGVYEIKRWSKEKEVRITLLKRYLDTCIEYKYQAFLPKAYFDDSLQIVPLRFVFTHPDVGTLRDKAASHFDVEGFWFLKPIVACDDPTDFGYVYGSCMNAEKSGKEIINFPCVLDHSYDRELIEHLKDILTDAA